MAASPILLSFILSLLYSSCATEGHDFKLSKLPKTLQECESPLDEASAKFLAAEFENGLVLNPKLCRHLGFFCEPGLRLNPEAVKWLHGHEGNSQPSTKILLDDSASDFLPGPNRWYRKAKDESATKDSKSLGLKSSAPLRKSLLQIPGGEKSLLGTRVTNEPKMKKHLEELESSPLEKSARGGEKVESALKKSLVEDSNMRFWLPGQKDESALKKSLLEDSNRLYWLPGHKDGSGASELKNSKRMLGKPPTFVKRLADDSRSTLLPQVPQLPNPMVFRISSLKRGSTLILPLLKEAAPNKYLHPLLRATLPFKPDHISKLLSTFGLPEDREISYLAHISAESCSRDSSRPQIEHSACALSTHELLQAVHKILHRELSECKGESCGLKWIAQEIPHEGMETMKVVGVKQLSETAAVCHAMAFPYTVYGCHRIAGTKVMQVTLVSDADDTKEPIVFPAICHMDTSEFNPEHPAFKMFNMKPGDGELCHWVQHRTIVWYV